MTYQVFFVAFTVSYLGSVPPGTINITTMQLAIQNNRRASFFFLLAATMVEFVYTALTVRFQVFLSTRPLFLKHFPVITGVVMLILGVVNLFSHTRSDRFMHTNFTGRSGLKKGIMLGALNPLTIPFWLAITAYLQVHQWIVLESYYFWIYLIGVAGGTFALLMTVRAVGGRFTRIADNQFLVHQLPGLIFITLGLYNLFTWWFS